MGKIKDKITYYITISDIQEIAKQDLDRELSPEELEFVQIHMGDYIPWADGVSLVMDEMLKNKRKSHKLKALV